MRRVIAPLVSVLAVGACAEAPTSASNMIVEGVDISAYPTATIKPVGTKGFQIVQDQDARPKALQGAVLQKLCASRNLQPSALQVFGEPGDKRRPILVICGKTPFPLLNSL